jgi:hypothetical protein
MPHTHMAMLLIQHGAEAEAEALIDSLLEEWRASPGYLGGHRIRSRTGHGPRWKGWIAAWRDRASVCGGRCQPGAADACYAVRLLAEPRSWHEFIFETDEVPSIEAAGLGGAGASRRV